MVVPIDFLLASLHTYSHWGWKVTTDTGWLRKLAIFTLWPLKNGNSLSPSCVATKGLASELALEGRAVSALGAVWTWLSWFFPFGGFSVFICFAFICKSLQSKPFKEMQWIKAADSTLPIKMPILCSSDIKNKKYVDHHTIALHKAPQQQEDGTWNIVY